MQTNAHAAPSEIIKFRVPGGAPRHHSLVIVSGATTRIDALESILETANRRGLHKIAKALRQRIAERDQKMLENALAAVDADFEISGTLVQFAAHNGVLHCRAHVEPEQEDQLILVLSRIPDVHRIALEVCSPA